jgi:hypothetical protein
MLFRVQELSNAVSSARLGYLTILFRAQGLCNATLGYLTMLFQVPGIEPRSSSS